MPISYDVSLLDKACKEFCLPESSDDLSLIDCRMNLLEKEQQREMDMTKIEELRMILYDNLN